MVWVAPDHGQAPTREHLIPLALGGHNDDLNVVLACRSCNEVCADQPLHIKHAFKEQATKLGRRKAIAWLLSIPR